MNTVLVTALLVGIALNLGLSVMLFFRGRSADSLTNQVRDDLRLGRDEARGAAKESRDDLALALRGMNEAIRDQGVLQQNHFAGIAHELKAFSEANRVVTTELRATLDARVKDIQEGSEIKLEKVRQALELIRDAVDQKLGRKSRRGYTQVLMRRRRSLIA
jgi:hypothetical protein